MVVEHKIIPNIDQYDNVDVYKKALETGSEADVAKAYVGMNKDIRDLEAALEKINDASDDPDSVETTAQRASIKRDAEKLMKKLNEIKLAFHRADLDRRKQDRIRTMPVATDEVAGAADAVDESFRRRDEANRKRRTASAAVEMPVKAVEPPASEYAKGFEPKGDEAVLQNGTAKEVRALLDRLNEEQKTAQKLLKGKGAENKKALAELRAQDPRAEKRIKDSVTTRRSMIERVSARLEEMGGDENEEVETEDRKDHATEVMESNDTRKISDQLVDHLDTLDAAEGKKQGEPDHSSNDETALQRAARVIKISSKQKAPKTRDEVVDAFARLKGSEGMSDRLRAIVRAGREGSKGTVKSRLEEMKASIKDKYEADAIKTAAKLVDDSVVLDTVNIDASNDKNIEPTKNDNPDVFDPTGKALVFDDATIEVRKEPVNAGAADSVVEVGDPKETNKSKEGGKKGWATRTQDYMSETVDLFFRKNFKGELVEEDDDLKKYDAGMTRAAAGLTLGITKAFISGGASYVGLKTPVDLLRWLYQRGYRNEEVKRLKEVLEKQLEEAEGVDVVKQRTEAMQKAISESKYIPKAKKEDLLRRLMEVKSQHDSSTSKTERAYTAKRDALLDEHVKTRVSGIRVIKESLNSLMFASGIAVGVLPVPGARVGSGVIFSSRAAAFTALSALERYQTVQTERASGTREGSLASEYISGGFSEWWKQLQGGDAQSKLGKVMNTTQAMTKLARGMAVGGMLMSGVARAAEPIDALLEMANNSLQDVAKNAVLSASEVSLQAAGTVLDYGNEQIVQPMAESISSLGSDEATEAADIGSGTEQSLALEQSTAQPRMPKEVAATRIGAAGEQVQVPEAPANEPVSATSNEASSVIMAVENKEAVESSVVAKHEERISSLVQDLKFVKQQDISESTKSLLIDHLAEAIKAAEQDGVMIDTKAINAQLGIVEALEAPDSISNPEEVTEQAPINYFETKSGQTTIDYKKVMDDISNTEKQEAASLFRSAGQSSSDVLKVRNMIAIYEHVLKDMEENGQTATPEYAFALEDYARRLTVVERDNTRTDFVKISEELKRNVFDKLNNLQAIESPGGGGGGGGGEGGTGSGGTEGPMVTETVSTGGAGGERSVSGSSGAGAKDLIEARKEISLGRINATEQLAGEHVVFSGDAVEVNPLMASDRSEVQSSDYKTVTSLLKVRPGDGKNVIAEDELFKLQEAVRLQAYAEYLGEKDAVTRFENFISNSLEKMDDSALEVDRSSIRATIDALKTDIATRYEGSIQEVRPLAIPETASTPESVGMPAEVAKAIGSNGKLKESELIPYLKASDIERAKDMFYVNVPRPGQYEKAAKLLAADIYALEQLEKAGLKDSVAYERILEETSERVLRLENVGKVVFNQEDPTFQKYFGDVIVPDQIEQLIVKLDDTHTRFEIMGDYGGDKGSVIFEYDERGKVVGLNKDELEIDPSPIKIRSLFTNPQGPVTEISKTQRGQLEAMQKIGRELLELAEIYDHMRDRNITGPEKDYVAKQMHGLIQQTNRQWEGRLRISLANPAVSRLFL